MEKLSDLLRYVETALFAAMMFCGLISNQLEVCAWLGFFGTLLIHIIIDRDYAHEWTDFIFGKEAK